MGNTRDNFNNTTLNQFETDEIDGLFSMSEVSDIIKDPKSKEKFEKLWDELSYSDKEKIITSFKFSIANSKDLIELTNDKKKINKIEERIKFMESFISNKK